MRSTNDNSMDQFDLLEFIRVKDDWITVNQLQSELKIRHKLMISCKLQKLWKYGFVIRQKIEGIGWNEYQYKYNDTNIKN